MSSLSTCPGTAARCPPEGWWLEDYLLTTREYRDVVLSVIDALGLADPIVLGCSMGGAIVLELARYTPDRIRAVIGMSGASRIEGRFADWAVRPDINENQVIPTFVSGLMAPQSPEEARREVWWVYSGGGSGTYRGDAHFYRAD